MSEGRLILIHIRSDWFDLTKMAGNKVVRHIRF